MRDIGKRVQKLESVLVPPAVPDRWDRLAAVRDDLIRRADPSRRDEVRAELEALGPVGLWIKFARDFLAEHGFVQAPRESLAETMARALDISTEELRTLMAQGKIGTALRERFPEAKPS